MSVAVVDKRFGDEKFQIQSSKSYSSSQLTEIEDFRMLENFLSSFVRKLMFSTY